MLVGLWGKGILKLLGELQVLCLFWRKIYMCDKSLIQHFEFFLETFCRIVRNGQKLEINYLLTSREAAE